jgi:DNA polymerase-4
VQLKVKFGDFHTITRSHTLEVPVDDAPALLQCSRSLLEQIDPSPGVRLLGVSVSGLTSLGSRQLTLDEAVDGPGWEVASRTIDEIRERFGSAAIGPATVMGPGGVRPKVRGQQQWGPDESPPT